eukprot:scaffold33855_cov18-Tisochrysis_lutea.AAC.1
MFWLMEMKESSCAPDKWSQARLSFVRQRGDPPHFLFSLYINDMGRDISEGIRGAVTGDEVNGVFSYMLCADDLTTSDPDDLG